jgi:hypothetical protein
MSLALGCFPADRAFVLMLTSNGTGRPAFCYTA